MIEGLKAKAKNLVSRYGDIAGTINRDNLVPLESIMTDYQKSTQNQALMAKVRLPFYAETKDGFDGAVQKWESETEGWLTGFMIGGFGWSIENEYEDLLPVTSAQKQVSKILQGGSLTMSMLPDWLVQNNSVLLDGANKAMMSLQQTMSMWVGMKKPSFNLKLLFFDGEGSESTSVNLVSYIIERSQYPYIHNVQKSGFNLFMSAPGGYRPLSRNDNNAGNPNKRYSLSAEGLAEVHIGMFMKFPELICTGASMNFSDIMLSNGKPQWVTVDLRFQVWRQQTLEDLKNRYV